MHEVRRSRLILKHLHKSCVLNSVNVACSSSWTLIPHSHQCKFQIHHIACDDTSKRTVKLVGFFLLIVTNTDTMQPFLTSQQTHEFMHQSAACSDHVKLLWHNPNGIPTHYASYIYWCACFHERFFQSHHILMRFVRGWGTEHCH